jgi:O-antigen/teichoic acid export membrane protein
LLIRTRTRTTKWNFFFHYSTIIFNIIVGVLLVPLYLKFIPSGLYGAWLATGNLLFWISILDPGFSQVVLQRISYFYGKDDRATVGNYAFLGILIGIIVSFFIGLIGTYFYFNFTEWLNLKNLSELGDLKSAFILSLFGTCIMMFSYSLISINQGLQSSLGIGLVYLIANIGSIVMTIVLLKKGFGIITLGWVTLYRAIIYFIGNLAYLLYRLYKENIKVRYSKSIKGDFSLLVSYNFLGKLGNTVLTQVNSFFVARLISTNQVSILRFSQSAPEMTKLFLVRPAIAITPALTHLLGEGDLEKSKKVLLRLMNYTIWGLGIAYVGFILFNGIFIKLWVGELFYAGDSINTLICILMFLTTITEVLSALVFSLGDIKKSNVIIFIQSIFFIIILFPFLKYYSLKGVIIASILSNLFFSFWYYPYSFFKISKISIIEMKPLFIEISKIFLISITLIICFKNTNPQTWFNFAKTIFKVILTYISILLLISKSFRTEFLIITKRLLTYVNLKI